MNKYFIKITAYQTRNILDQRLQKEFLDLFGDRIITTDQLPMVKNAFDYVCTKYKSEGGRATMEFRDFMPYGFNDSSLHAQVCKAATTSMYIDLTKIRGEVQL